MVLKFLFSYNFSGGHFITDTGVIVPKGELIRVFFLNEAVPSLKPLKSANSIDLNQRFSLSLSLGVGLPLHINVGLSSKIILVSLSLLLGVSRP